MVHDLAKIRATSDDPNLQRHGATLALVGGIRAPLVSTVTWRRFRS
jgi:hypothetical protein